MDKRYRILAVDDEYVNTQLIKSALGEEYDILTALNGLEAIDLLKQYRPDLILLDVMMPDLSGFDVCKIIRADAANDPIPIIFLTAFDSPEGQLEGFELGGIEYLTKPVNLGLLKLRVRNHLLMKEQLDLMARQKRELEAALTELKLQNERQLVTDKALRESEARFRNLLQNIPSVAVQGYALDGTTQYWNKASELLYGYSEQEAVGSSLLDLIIPPEMKEGVTQAMRQMSETGEAIPASELILMRKDGSRVPVFSSHAVVQGTGREMELFCLDIDISERKKTEETQLFLLNSVNMVTGEDFFASLARFLAETLDMDYVCIDRLLGDGLAAQTLAIYFDGVFEDNVEYTLKDTPCGDVVGKTICVFPREVRHQFMQDQILQDMLAESYVGTTLRSFDGKPIGLIAVIGRKPLENISLAESVLKLVSIRAASELERIQAEKDKLRLEQQFQQAQKMESLGVLAGGIAHDFNNILAVIICNCSLALQRPHMAGELIVEIDTAAQRAAELCRQMLAYAGKSMFLFKPVKMASLVRDMIKILNATISQNAVINTDLADDIPPISGDASQINQIIMNLIINAAEAIGEAQGAIGVALSKTEFKTGQTETDHLGWLISPGWYVCLEVTDTGCGMDDETRRKIFEPFYTTKFTGRGLGMSAVLGIITAHKGAMQILSQPGQGSSFKVYLPALTVDTVREPLLPSEPAAWQGDGTILLVEDEPQLLTVAKNLMKALGFKVFEAKNGREALELYRKNAELINLVVTDIGMPIMDGYELFRELKKITPELPIIISSGFGDVDVASRISGGEIAGILSKPYRFEQLRDVLKSVVEEMPRPQR